MKLTKSILILNLALWLGFSQMSYAQNTKKQVGPKLNAAEQAINFETGTKAQFTDWADDGGLNRVSSWFGIELMSVEIQRGNDGLLQFAALVPNQTTSIKEMKTALGKVCGIKADDWDREDQPGRTTLKAQGTKCRADFNNWFRGKGIWGISIYKS